MTDYYLAWRDLFTTRDDFYLIALLLVASVYVWYTSPLKFRFSAYYVGALAMVLALTGWGFTLL